jgi:hypothetical protein
MQINFTEIKKQINPEQIVQVLYHLGAESYEDRGKFIIFPTICHNHRDHSKSMKLYYYKETRLFRCYTECNESFDIFDLWQRVEKLAGEEKSLFEIADKIVNLLNIDIDTIDDVFKYQRPLTNRLVNELEFDYPIINSDFLNFFSDYKHPLWLQEGISEASFNDYLIKYYSYRNKIIIPHFDPDNRLIGIRSRNLEPEDLAMGKYMPVKVENKTYSHPLSFNLYGLNVSKKDIQRSKLAFVFEGEKSCLKFNSLFDFNYSVATCGSSINKFQVMLLKKYCAVQEIVICFDRQYETKAEKEKYYDKLHSLTSKYSSYCNMSFIFDDSKILKHKNAPIDQGKEIFIKLFENRTKIRS